MSVVGVGIFVGLLTNVLSWGLKRQLTWLGNKTLGKFEQRRRRRERLQISRAGTAASSDREFAYACTSVQVYLHFSAIIFVMAAVLSGLAGLLPQEAPRWFAGVASLVSVLLVLLGTALLDNAGDWWLAVRDARRIERRRARERAKADQESEHLTFDL